MLDTGSMNEMSMVGGMKVCMGLTSWVPINKPELITADTEYSHWKQQRTILFPWYDAILWGEQPTPLEQIHTGKAKELL